MSRRWVTKRNAKILSTVATVAIVGLSIGAGLWLLSTGPRQKKVPRAAAVPKVEVQPLEAADHPVSIEAFGTVRPAREVTLAPQVEGPVVAIHPNMEPGARVRAGELLVQIDPIDYRIGVRSAEAALHDAQATLALEAGQQQIAKKEWAFFLKNTGDAPEAATEALALRTPQLRQARARIAAAQARLDSARLQLRRTDLVAPFNAFVREESVEIGRRAGPNTPLLTLVGTDAFWVVVTLPLAQATRLDSLAEGSPAQVHLAAGLGDTLMRPARFVRRLPNVTTQGRMARALVAIDDPLGAASGPVIPLGSFVRVTVDAGAVTDSYVVPREAIRENGRVWVRDAQGTLQHRPIDVVWRREATVLVRASFTPGDQLITSYLPDPLPGTKVQLRRSP